MVFTVKLSTVTGADWFLSTGDSGGYCFQTLKKNAKHYHPSEFPEIFDYFTNNDWLKGFNWKVEIRPAETGD